MINFIKNFIYYLCYEVIEENWLVFTQNLKKVKTFEDII
jgi:gamma-tubulin complex component 2